jgi:hypothetical protein
MGVVAAIACYAAIQKDKQCTALYERMIAMAERSSDRYHSAVIETTKTIGALAERIDHDLEDR